VPVFVGHCEAVHVVFSKAITPEAVVDRLREAPGVTIHDEPSVNLYPTPLDAAGRDDTYVGRVRQDPSDQCAIAFWLASDNLRKGAALNAIQIAEELIARDLV
jgi:aspartate-semialdehyde dehydrogenase